MSTEENIVALMTRLQHIDATATAIEAPTQVIEALATLVLLLLRDHPKRKQVETLVTKSLVTALSVAETSTSALN